MPGKSQEEAVGFVRKNIPPALCGRKALVVRDFNHNVPASQLFLTIVSRSTCIDLVYISFGERCDVCLHLILGSRGYDIAYVHGRKCATTGTSGDC